VAISLVPELYLPTVDRTTPEGTRLTSLLELHTTGLMVLAEPLIASSVRREMDVDYVRLKDMLESRVPEAFELLE
jgi:hypothetical protein